MVLVFGVSQLGVLLGSVSSFVVLFWVFFLR